MPVQITVHDSSVKEAVMATTSNSRWVRLSEYGAVQIAGERTMTIPPARVIFPYGKRVPLDSMADMPVAVAN